MAARNGWRSSDANGTANDSLRFEFEARPTAANLNGLVAVGAESIDSFDKAAIAVRFAGDGLVDVRDGALFASDMAYPYEPGVWYSIGISADIDTQTYTVEIGPCGEARQTLIEDASFRDDAEVSGQLSTWAVWSSQKAALEVSTPAWIASGDCVPATCESLGQECGQPGDGCGGTLECGGCSNTELCDSGLCVEELVTTPPPPACVPDTCELVRIECGVRSDGCGGYLACGDCQNGYSCNDGVCVQDPVTPPPPPVCEPETCDSLNRDCGVASDRCGGTLSCGACATGETCMSGGSCVAAPTPPPACVPHTCQSLGRECGFVGDGCGGTLNCGSCGSAGTSPVPAWVQYPGPNWELTTLTPTELGFNATAWANYTSQTPTVGDCGGDNRNSPRNGTCVQRGGCLLHCWGNPDALFQTASLGKAFNGYALQLLIDDGIITGDETPSEVWPGAPNDCGGSLKQMFDMRGGYYASNGSSHGCGNPCGRVAVGTFRYSSGGMWRLNQTMTYLTQTNFNEDLKEYLQRKLFTPMGIEPGDWYWMSGQQIYDNEPPQGADPSQTVTYPDWNNPPLRWYGCFVDPPYTIGGKTVHGGGGWVGMTPKDLARISLLLASDGWWDGTKLITKTSLVEDRDPICGGNGLGASSGGGYTNMWGWGRSGQDGLSLGPGSLITGPINDPTRSCTSGIR